MTKSDLKIYNQVNVYKGKTIINLIRHEFFIVIFVKTKKINVKRLHTRYESGGSKWETKELASKM